MNFHENLRGGLGQTDRNNEPESDFSALKRGERGLEKGRARPVLPLFHRTHRSRHCRGHRGDGQERMAEKGFMA